MECICCLDAKEVKISSEVMKIEPKISENDFRETCDLGESIEVEIEPIKFLGDKKIKRLLNIAKNTKKIRIKKKVYKRAYKLAYPFPLSMY